jgi:hypothetical protein
MHVGVGADDVVVREQVREAEVLDTFAVGANGTDITTELGLWEDNPDAHSSPRLCRKESQLVS